MMQTAQKEAAIPIKPTRLSPSSKLLKSRSVILKMIKAKARITNMDVKIFI
jgi:hypothetical protein